MVPQGGLFWDGRADTLQDQALVPLLNPLEMDGGSVEAVAAQTAHAPYAPRFVQLFGRRSSTPAPRGGRGDVRGRRAIRSRSRASIPTPASSITGWKEGALQRRRRCAATSCSTIRQRRIAAAAIWTSQRRRPAAAVHRSAVRGTGRAAQRRADGQPRSRLLRSGDLRAVSHRHGEADAVLRHVPDADAAQRRDAAQCSSTTVCFTRCSRCWISTISAMSNRGGSIRTPRTARSKNTTTCRRLSSQRRHRGSAVRPQARRKPAMTTQDEADIIAFLNTLTDGYRPGKQP